MEKTPRLSIGVAFQPVVNIHSGRCTGYEVLIDGVDPAQYTGTQAFLTAMHDQGRLAEVELEVRRLAAAKAAALPHIGERTLFFNLDCRAAASWAAISDLTATLFRPIAAQTVCDLANVPDDGLPSAWTALLRRNGGLLAVDRLGDCARGLHLLHRADPDYLKIGRSLIERIDQDPRKRVVVAQLVGMAHTLGLQVVAVGVENSRECMVCRELGCDLVQGYFLQPPTAEPEQIADHFPQMENLLNTDRRRRQIDQRWIAQQLELVPAIRIDTPMNKVFDRFARNPNESFLPVVDHAGQPLGILRERDMKNYAYSAFGKDLISNKALGRSPRDFLVRCPITDIGTPLDQMMAIYSAIDATEGLLVTEQMVYRGFLSARSIIRAMHEKTLARARDENPLTKLPGNAVITEYVGARIASAEESVLAYIDFDNFKPFNDTYGFRQGDRAILLFAELLRKGANPQSWFLGHIGGDDFFLGLSDCGEPEGRRTVAGLIRQFASDAESFYDADTRARGFITAQDRDGTPKQFPLLSASAVLLHLPVGAKSGSVDDISSLIAGKKKAAKHSPDKLALAFLPGTEPSAVSEAERIVEPA